jgi:hypothetical protein
MQGSGLSTEASSFDTGTIFQYARSHIRDPRCSRVIQALGLITVHREEMFDEAAIRRRDDGSATRAHAQRECW